MTDGSATETDETAGSYRLRTDGGAAEGVVTIESDASVDESVDRVKDTIEGIDGLSLMAEFDHAANAATVDRDLL